MQIGHMPDAHMGRTAMAAHQLPSRQHACSCLLQSAAPSRKTYRRQSAAQVQVLQLYNLQWSPRDTSLSLMAPTCARLHTLTLCGPLVLDVACLEQLPCLRSLSLAYCKKATLSSLPSLSQLRCVAPVSSKRTGLPARLAGRRQQIVYALGPMLSSCFPAGICMCWEHLPSPSS